MDETALKARNIVLDWVFYDVGQLTPSEQCQLWWASGMKGSIVVVPPTGSGTPLRFYRNALHFMTAEGDDIRAVAIAGVGSSIFGTAALACNVADAIGLDVAGIVSGYGLADVVEEAWGGWFAFGYLDRLQRAIEDILHHGLEMHPTPAKRGFLSLRFNLFDPAVPGWGMPGDEDTGTLVDILMSRPKGLGLLVGHSKGSLIIDAALEQFVYDLTGLDHYLLNKLKVVTLSAVADIPGRFNSVSQVIGSFDWFGGLKSRPDVEHKVWPNAFHHLSSRFWFHLNAVEAIQAALK